MATRSETPPRMFSIVVSDPEKHGTSPVNAFVDFKIHTKTDMPQFASCDFFVRRRYRDFVWLRGQLCQSCPGCIVPPLPVMDSLLKDDRFSSAFILRRQAGLELFLRRVADHEELSQSESLQTFLEAKVWELQTAQNAARGEPSWFSTIFDGTESSLKRIQSSFRQKVADEGETEKLRAFTADYDAHISAAAAKHHATVRTMADMGADLRQLGPAVDMLSQTETELSLPFNRMAETLDRLKALHLQQVQSEHISGLAALLAFNSGMASALKEVLSNRDKALLHYQSAAAAVDGKMAERERWQAHMAQLPDAQSPRSSFFSTLDGFVGRAPDPKKGAQIDAKLAEARQELAVAKERWEGVSKSIPAEVERFHCSTNVDFGRGLRQHINEQIQFQEAQQEQWHQLLNVFKEMEGS